jgi:hypothetical protein
MSSRILGEDALESAQRLWVLSCGSVGAGNVEVSRISKLMYRMLMESPKTPLAVCTTRCCHESSPRATVLLDKLPKTDHAANGLPGFFFATLTILRTPLTAQPTYYNLELPNLNSNAR